MLPPCNTLNRGTALPKASKQTKNLPKKGLYLGQNRKRDSEYQYQASQQQQHYHGPHDYIVQQPTIPSTPLPPSLPSPSRASLRVATGRDGARCHQKTEDRTKDMLTSENVDTLIGMASTRVYADRRRNSRLKGADLYVVRLSGRGNRVAGKCDPCARCMAWARWAGLKRIFHWSVAEGVGRWDVVKVNDMDSQGYLTQADLKRDCY